MPDNLVSFEVSESEAGKTLLQVIKGRVPHLSSRQIKALLDRRLCKMNGQIERFSSRRVFVQEHIELALEPQNSFQPQEDLLLKESQDTLFINKPASVKMPASQSTHFLNYVNIHLVHRLDKETSGALALATTKASQLRWEEAFKKRLVKKAYLALCDGVFPLKEQVISCGMGLDKKIEGQSIYRIDPHIPPNSKTYFWGMGTGEKASLVLCFPKTGRTHQLRVHLSSIGHPILGDRQYSSHFRTPWVPERILLHSFYLKAPWEKEGVFAPIPKDFLQAMQILKISYTLEHLEEKVLACGY